LASVLGAALAVLFSWRAEKAAESAQEAAAPKATKADAKPAAATKPRATKSAKSKPATA